MKRWLALALPILAGCAGLTPGGALQTAHDAARTACAVLAVADGGDPQAVAEQLAALLRTVVEQQALSAAEREENL